MQVDARGLRSAYTTLGPMSQDERVVLYILIVLMFLWFTRAPSGIPGWSTLLPSPEAATDGTAAVFAALLLFFIPSKRNPGESLLTWAACHRFPWDLVLLLGGGFALASSFQASGASSWIASILSGFAGVPLSLLQLILCSFITSWTELNSNVATATIVLPIAAQLAVSVGTNPLYLLVPATVSTSFAFMLPVATPPNAVAFGTGFVKIRTMMAVGLFLNVACVCTTVIMMAALGPTVYAGRELPEWAKRTSTNSSTTPLR